MIQSSTELTRVPPALSQESGELIACRFTHTGADPVVSTKPYHVELPISNPDMLKALETCFSDGVPPSADAAFDNLLDSLIKYEHRTNPDTLYLYFG